MERPFTSLRNRISGKKKVILFLSTGDICRSPMAAGYLRKLLQDRKILNVDVRPAGVLTVPGLRASQEAMQIMEIEGVDLTRHRSSQLSYEMARKADLILGMTPLHVQEALRVCKEARGKAFLLKEFTASDLKNIQITDPMGSTLEVFKKCFKEIKDACSRLMESEFVAGPSSRKAKAPAPLAPMPRREKPKAKPARAAEAKKPAPAPKAAAKAKRADKKAGTPKGKKPETKKAAAKPAPKKPATKPSKPIVKKAKTPAKATKPALPIRSVRGAGSAKNLARKAR